MLLKETRWTQVTSKNPCPLCGKPDWCSRSDNGEAVLCRRTDPGLQPTQWKHIKNSSDGYPIYVVQGSQEKHTTTKRINKVAKPIPCPIPAGKIQLAFLPEAVTAPEKEKITKSWGYDITIKYPYSPTQYVERTEHYDLNGDRLKINKKTKITLPYHQNNEGKWIKSKGQQEWAAYRLSEAIAHGSNKWVLGVEGESCVETARSLSLVCNTMQGGSWGEIDLGIWLTQLKNNDVKGLVYWPDHDTEGQRKAAKILEVSGKVKFPVLVLDPLEIWAEIPETGDIADWVKWGLTQEMDAPEFIKRLELAIHSELEKRHSSPSQQENTPNQQTGLPKQSKLVSEIAERYINKFKYNNECNSWMEYQEESSQRGAWIPVTPIHIQTQIYHILQARNYEFNSSYLNGVEELLRKALYIKEWPKTPNLLPFSDCVLDLHTGKTREHNPNNYLTWVLPRPYNIIELSWGRIDNWLNEATRGNLNQKQVLLCYAAAVLRRRADLQKFLHIIGTGGSGKSTFMNLLVALVGQQNTISLDFSSLNEKDAIAEVFGKVLAIFPDQDTAGKNISNFKKITGQDLLRGRRLYKDGFNFRFEGMCAVSSNHPIFHSGSGRWLTRRVVMVPFDLAVPDGKVRNLEKEFQPELSAFTSYLLSIPEAEIEATLKGLNTHQAVSSTLWESQIRSDGLASWINDEMVFDCTTRTQIGSNAHEWDNLDYNPTTSTLFGSYCRHIKRSGRQPLTKDNFSANLIELLKGTLKKEVEKIKTNQGRFLTGVRLRTTSDFDIPCLDELLENLESDEVSDDLSDEVSDDLKSLSDKESDDRDDLAINIEAKENLLVELAKNDPLKIEQETSSSTDLVIDDNLNDSVVTVVTTQSQQDVEVVTDAVTVEKETINQEQTADKKERPLQPGDRVIDDGGWKGTIKSIHFDGKKAEVYLDLMESVHPIDLKFLSLLFE